MFSLCGFFFHSFVSLSLFSFLSCNYPTSLIKEQLTIMKGKEIQLFSPLGWTPLLSLRLALAMQSTHWPWIADAFHMLNDIFSLIVALWAVRVAKSRGVDSKYTYGWQRAEILGALVNTISYCSLHDHFPRGHSKIYWSSRNHKPQAYSDRRGTAGLISNIIGLFLSTNMGTPTVVLVAILKMKRVVTPTSTPTGTPMVIAIHIPGRLLMSSMEKT